MPHASRVRLLPVAIVVAIGLFGTIGYSENDVQPINNLPNPYRTVRDWGHPPNGAPWAAVTAVEVSPDGSIYVIHRCHDNSCADRTEPPILKFDASGKLLKAWGQDRKSTRLNSSHLKLSRMPSSA